MSDNTIALNMEDDMEKLIDQIYVNASMACGYGQFEKLAHQHFCKDMSRMESILRNKGLLPRREI